MILSLEVVLVRDGEALTSINHGFRLSSMIISYLKKFDLGFIFFLLLLQLVLCCVAALKSLPIHHPLCRLYFPFGPLRSARVF